MNPELAFVVLLALLWGPTAAWLVYQVVRGPGGRRPESFASAEELRSADRSSSQLEGPVSTGFWACTGCKSVNRPEAKHCYSCKADKPRVDETPTQLPPGGRPLVPVMDERLAGTWPDAATTALLAARPQGRSQARDPDGPVLLTAANVCPFLGFKDDPAARFNFPDTRNVCHSAAPTATGMAATRRRPAGGRPGSERSIEIPVELQQALCLTAAHAQCARYPDTSTVADAQPERVAVAVTTPAVDAVTGTSTDAAPPHESVVAADATAGASAHSPEIEGDADAQAGSSPTRRRRTRRRQSGV